ncbi:UNVERIFIED_CONTAM: Dynamin-related protein 1C [Sesamum radiatum]|uniref:Dynamin-related protein 1C n=1 Tax=Sesamum radiatum TaxID=300843 RepID=A0AAW2JRJ0_SESRA
MENVICPGSILVSYRVCAIQFSNLIGTNVSAYINLVCDTMRNTIPKAVVHCQVREAKRALLNHFYVQIGRREKEQLGKMLDEDPSLMAKRETLAKRLELYKSARDEIDSVAWK